MGWRYPVTTLASLFADCHEELEHGDPVHAIALLSEGLTEYRLEMAEDQWQGHVLQACRAHPLDALLLEDPYTRRARQRPRGYAGDAVMMDYAYFRTPPEGCSEMGRRVFGAVVASPNSASVRWRREHIAGLIDAEARLHGSLSVLAVACGHCREGLLLRGDTLQAIEEFVALDQDARSLEVVRRTLLAHVVPLRAAAQSLARKPGLYGFDFIYSAGLYDYLDEPAAVELTRLLVERAAPGGTVLVANFTPDNWGRGYMEACMDWRLVLRNREDMRRLVPTQRVAHSCLYFDPYRNAIYLKIIRA